MAVGQRTRVWLDNEAWEGHVLDIAMALRLKGIADAAAIAEMTGASTDAVDSVLATMVESGHAKETPRGLMITPEGKEWVGGLLDEERAGIDLAAMNEVYERFCAHNDDFKQLVTDWQMREVDGEQVPNDHSDADYDATIFQRLADLDGQVAPVFADAAALAPRLERYLGRFRSALDVVCRAGLARESSGRDRLALTLDGRLHGAEREGPQPGGFLVGHELSVLVPRGLDPAVHLELGALAGARGIREHGLVDGLGDVEDAIEHGSLSPRRGSGTASVKDGCAVLGRRCQERGAPTVGEMTWAEGRGG